MRIIFLIGGIYLFFVSPFVLSQPKKLTPDTTQKQQSTTENIKTPENQEKKINTDKKEEDSLENNFSNLLEKELNEGNTSQIKSEGSTSWVWQILKTTFFLIIMMFIFWFIYKFYLIRKNFQSDKESNVLQVLYEYKLLPNKTLQFIKIHNRILLLGISEAGIQLITEITDENSINQILLDTEKESLKDKPDFLLELTKEIKNKVNSIKKNVSNTRLTDKEVSSNIDTNNIANSFSLDSLRGNTSQILDKLKSNKEEFKS